MKLTRRLLMFACIMLMISFFAGCVTNVGAIELFARAQAATGQYASVSSAGNPEPTEITDALPGLPQDDPTTSAAPPSGSQEPKAVEEPSVNEENVQPNQAQGITTTPKPVQKINSTQIPVVTAKPNQTAIPTQTAATAIPKAIPTATTKPTAVPTPTASPTQNAPILLDELMGKTTAQIVALYGQPQSYELSEYGFMWSVYSGNYSKFLLVGIKNGRVVGVYSNSGSLSFTSQTVGKVRNSVRSAIAVEYGSPLTIINKNGTYVPVQLAGERDVFYGNGTYATVFYDNTVGGKLTAVQIIEEQTEKSIIYYGTPSEALARSTEKISFHLANGIRARMGISKLTWDNSLATVARAHSLDMYARKFFSHTNPDGLSSADRISRAGINYSICAENIMKGHPGAISGHEAFMNSSGHRANILRSIKCLGVGVIYASDGVYLTQNYATLR